MVGFTAEQRRDVAYAEAQMLRSQQREWTQKLQEVTEESARRAREVMLSYERLGASFSHQTTGCSFSQMMLRARQNAQEIQRSQKEHTQAERSPPAVAREC